MVKIRHLGIVVLITSLAALSGCGAVATRTGFHEPITSDFQAGNFPKAAAGIEQARSDGKYGKKDRLLYYLDSGVVYHYAGELDSSNAKLTMAEEAADELFTKSVTRAAGSLLLNDNLLEYAGEDYEILYANLLMALNYMSIGQFDDAFVEIRRSNEKLELLEQKYAGAVEQLNAENESGDDSSSIDYEAAKVRFYNDAFARYLSMRIYAADGKMDDARIDFDYLNDAFEIQPHIYDFPIPEVKQTAEEGALLSVVALAGLSPVKEAMNLRIRTDKDLDLVQVLYTDSENKDSEYGHLPMPISEDYYFKFAIPKLVPRLSNVAVIKVYSDSRLIGELGLLEDISKVAEETFKAKSSLIYFKSVARAVAKGLAAHKAKKKADSGGFEGWLKKVAIDVVTDVSENADLRCARYLPGKIFVGDFEVEPGVYDLKIVFFNFDGIEIMTTYFLDEKINSSGLNLLETFCPN
ncbi:MAG: hypothetical protein V3W18_07490 [candidate division Zixibacteria bacterium]